MSIYPLNHTHKMVGYLCSRLSADDRKYHNLQHIFECLDHLKYVRDVLMQNIVLGIWYHDIIYNPMRANNEKESAEYFQEQAGLTNIDQGVVDFVSEMIIATKDHKIPNDLPMGQKLQLQYFLDIDLSILGASWERFEEYNKQIREEYDFVPVHIYRDARTNVLKGFLEREHIFHTPKFQEQFETKARVNIKRVLWSM